jgi:hypothetical protein
MQGRSARREGRIGSHVGRRVVGVDGGSSACAGWENAGRIGALEISIGPREAQG